VNPGPAAVADQAGNISESEVVAADREWSLNSPFAVDGAEINNEEGLTEEEKAQLDQETLELLEDMTKQEAELEAILSRHKEDAEELTGIRDAMVKELEMLKQEAWKLEAMHELKDMTAQLDDILERGTPASSGNKASEAAAPPEAAPAEAAKGTTVEEETREQMSRQEVNEQVSAMLDAEEAILDEELDVLRAQLSDIKLQAAEMDKRRDALMKELAEFEMPDRWDADEAVAAEAPAAATV